MRVDGWLADKQTTAVASHCWLVTGCTVNMLYEKTIKVMVTFFFADIDTAETADYLVNNTMITFSSGVVSSSIIMASTVVATIVNDDSYEAFEDLQIIIDSTSIEGLAFSNQAINFTIQDPEGM